MTNSHEELIKKLIRSDRKQKKALQKIEQNIEHQRKMLGICLAISCLAGGFVVYDVEGNIPEPLQKTLDNVILALITGAGALSSTSFLSLPEPTKDDEDEDDEI